MNLLDPNCGLDPEERREILLHTDAGRAVIAAEDAEMSRAVLFANGLPPGWSVGAYVKGPKKGSPCLIKGVRGQPGGVQVKPIPEGYEPDQQGGLRRKGGGDTTQASPAAASSEQPRQPTTIALDDGSRRMADAAKADIERLVARASSSPAQANLIRSNVHNRVRTLSRPEMEDVAAHLGIVAAHGGKFPNKRAVLHAIVNHVVDHVASQIVRPGTPLNASAATHPPSAPTPGPVSQPRVGTAQVTHERLRDVLRQKYEYLCRLVEFQDRLVELPRLFDKAKEELPGLTPDQFHTELLSLENERAIELHILNEVHTANRPELAIRRGNAMYYYAYWKR